MAAAVLLACALPSAAGAQVVEVNVSGDPAPDGTCAPAPGDCTLREALTQDVAPEVQVPDGTYDVNDTDIRIMHDVRIRGTGVGPGDHPSGRRVHHRIFEIASDSEVEISHVRLVDGVEIGDNGGAILINSAGLLLLMDSEISGNFAAEGGGIWADGELAVRNSLIVSNRAEASGLGHGGGIGLGAGFEGATMVNTTLSDNLTDGQGGGITRGARWS